MECATEQDWNTCLHPMIKTHGLLDCIVQRIARSCSTAMYGSKPRPLALAKTKTLLIVQEPRNRSFHKGCLDFPRGFHLRESNPGSPSDLRRVVLALVLFLNHARLSVILSFLSVRRFVGIPSLRVPEERGRTHSTQGRLDEIHAFVRLPFVGLFPVQCDRSSGPVFPRAGSQYRRESHRMHDQDVGMGDTGFFHARHGSVSGSSKPFDRTVGCDQTTPFLSFFGKPIGFKNVRIY